jgi:hypothetical protein
MSELLKCCRLKYKMLYTAVLYKSEIEVSLFHLLIVGFCGTV